MKKKKYVRPEIEVTPSFDICEYIPVHFSKEGTGQVDGKEMFFDEEEDNEDTSWGTRTNMWDN